MKGCNVTAGTKAEGYSLTGHRGEVLCRLTRGKAINMKRSRGVARLDYFFTFPLVLDLGKDR